MRRLDKLKTTTYQLNDYRTEYRVDITEDDMMFEAYLYNAEKVMKLFVLGEPKVQCIYGKEEEVTLDDFVRRTESYIELNELVDEYEREIERTIGIE